MSLHPVNKKYSAGVAGLVTEGNGLAVAENSTQSESNYEIMRNGTRRRRRPIVQELPHGYTSVGQIINMETDAVSSYVWTDIRGRDDLTVMVTQVGFEVRLHVQLNSSALPIENDIINRIDLRYNNTNNPLQVKNTYQEDIRKHSCTYAQGNGYLYIFHQIAGTIRVSWTGSTGAAWRITPIDRVVRDFEGINVAELDYAFHWSDNEAKAKMYNRYNEGWREKSLEAYAQEHPGDSYPGPVVRQQTGRSVDGNGVYKFDAESVYKEATSKLYVTPSAKGSLIKTSSASAIGGSFQKVHDGLPYFSATIEQAGTTIPYHVLKLHYEGRSLVDPIHCWPDTYTMFNSLRYSITDGTTVHIGSYAGLLKSIQSIGAGGQASTDLTRYLPYLGAGTWTVTLHEADVVYQEHRQTPDAPNQVGVISPWDSYAAEIYDIKNPVTGTVYAGRLWQTSDIYSRIYYSQALDARNDSEEEHTPKESLCFQVNDPTDADINDVIASDGGYLVIQEMGNEVGCSTLGKYLVLFAENGVWAVGPGEEGLFKPDDFSVTRVSKIGASSLNGIVDVEGGIAYMSHQGMAIISYTKEQGLRSADISSQTIKTVVDTLTYQEKKTASVAYDSVLDAIRFSLEREGVNQMFTYAIPHKAWYQYDTVNSESLIRDIVALPDKQSILGENRFRYLIASDLDGDYTYNWGAEATFSDRGEPSYVEYNGEHIFSDFRMNEVSQESAPAHMHTHPLLFGEGSRFQQVNYLHLFNQRVDTHWYAEFDDSMSPNLQGSVMLQGRWDWSDHVNSGKETNAAETYKHRRSFFHNTDGDNKDGEPILVTKNKVRGRGRELSVHLSTEGNYDAHIVGFSVEGLVLKDI